jgi:hypothetical protein
MHCFNSPFLGALIISHFELSAAGHWSGSFDEKPSLISAVPPFNNRAKFKSPRRSEEISGAVPAPGKGRNLP